MKARFLVTGLIGGLALVAVAMLLAGRFTADGPTAHAAPVPQWSIDADPFNGAHPCDPVDATKSIAVGTDFRVAICLENQPLAPSAFLARVLWSDAIDSGPECKDTGPLTCVTYPNNAAPAIDDNPDANVGVNNWPNAAGQILGFDWDCTGFGAKFPTGTESPGTSVITCNASVVDGTITMASTGAVALLTLHADSAGVEDITFDGTTVATDTNGSDMMACSDPATTPCVKATITKVVPADVEVFKTATTDGIAGGTLTYHLVATNHGPAKATNIFMVDDLENDVTFNAGLSSPSCFLMIAPAATPPPPPYYPNPGLGEPDFTNVVACNTGGDLDVGESTSVDIVVDVPLVAAGKPEINFALASSGFAPLGIPGVMDPNLAGTLPEQLALCVPKPLGPCNNAQLLVTVIKPAVVTVTKTATGSLFSEGDTIPWTVTVSNALLHSSYASSVVITDTLDSNQGTPITASVLPATCTEAGGVPAVVGNVITCHVVGTIAPGASVVMNVTAKVLHSVGSKCNNDVTVAWAEPTGTAHADVTCLPPTVRMEKDTDLSTVTPDNIVNLWLCKGATCTNNGEGQWTVYERVFNAKNDPDGVGAFEFQLKYDQAVFDISIAPTDWLWPAGRIKGPVPPGDCSFSIINENDIRFGCVSKDDPSVPGIGPGQLLDGVAAVITVTPDADLMYRMTPGQDNGTCRMILNEGCELADIYGDPLMLKDGQGNDIGLAPGVSNGGLVDACTDLAVCVRILEADLNLDCKVDIQDDQAEAYRYGASFGNLLYDPWYDLQPALKDYDIDIKDLQKVFGRNGSTCAAPIPPQDPVPPLN